MASVTLTWAGGEHPFELRIGELRALQQRCDAGPAWILGRLTKSQWMVDDVIETIRLGLEGGGMEKADARKLVTQFVEERPFTDSVLTAQTILFSALYGDPDDVLNENEGEKPGEQSGETVNPLSPEESGAGAKSSDTAQSSDSPPSK